MTNTLRFLGKVASITLAVLSAVTLLLALRSQGWVLGTISMTEKVAAEDAAKTFNYAVAGAFLTAFSFAAVASLALVVITRFRAVAIARWVSPTGLATVTLGLVLVQCGVFVAFSYGPGKTLALLQVLLALFGGLVATHFLARFAMPAPAPRLPVARTLVTC